MKNYRLYFSGGDAMFDIRVNGIPVIKKSFPEELASSQPINQMLIPGKNEITVNFKQSRLLKDRSFVFDKDLADGFFISVRLDVESKNIDDSVDVIYLVQDGDKYKAINKSLKNIEFNREGEVANTGSVSEFSTSSFVTNFGKEYESNLVKITVYIDDDNLDEAFWGDAIPFDLTDEVKSKVVDKYKDIRGYVEHNNGEEYLDLFSDVWDRTAKAYGLGDKDYFVKNMDAMNPQNIGEGQAFGEFDFSKEEYSFEQFNNGRFVRILPTPIHWADHYIEVSPVFYFDKNMNIHAVSIATD